MRVINNQDRVADQVNALNLPGVEACGDDGSVIVSVSGGANAREVAQRVLEVVGNPVTGDGVQEGTLWLNDDENNIHDELWDVANS